MKVQKSVEVKFHHVGERYFTPVWQVSPGEPPMVELTDLVQTGMTTSLFVPVSVYNKRPESWWRKWVEKFEKDLAYQINDTWGKLVLSVEDEEEGN